MGTRRRLLHGSEDKRLADQNPARRLAARLPRAPRRQPTARSARIRIDDRRTVLWSDFDPSRSAKYASGSLIRYQYIRSRGVCQAHGRFDALVGSNREVWLGDDGSGVIRDTRTLLGFFCESERQRWQAAGKPALSGLGERTYTVGLGGHSSETLTPGWRWTDSRDQLAAALDHRGRALQEVHRTLGEGIVNVGTCRLIADAAASLQRVTVVDELTDEFGRTGPGLVGIESGKRIELVFATDFNELLGYRWTLIEPTDAAPAGAMVASCSYLERAVVDRLPPAPGRR